jgi:hypothetical protein
MQNGSDDSTNDRSCQVQPGIAEIAGRHHRTKRPRRVEGGARECSTHEDVEGQRHPGRQRCEAAGAAGDGGAEYDRDQEKGEQDLDREAGSGRDRERDGAQSEVVRECGRAANLRKHAGKHFHATRHRTIEGYDPPKAAAAVTSMKCTSIFRTGRRRIWVRFPDITEGLIAKASGGDRAPLRLPRFRPGISTDTARCG